MKRKIFFTIFLLFFAFCLISLGIYFNYLMRPQSIASNLIDKGNYLINNFFKQTNEYFDLGDNFSINSKIKTNMSSEYYTNDSLVNLESLKKYNRMKNISNLSTEINFKQDRENKKVYFMLSEKFDNEDLVLWKYLIDNSTEYYFINNFVDSYVNSGSCNYFEMFNEENGTKDNVDYLYNFIIESLKRNLKNDYFKKYIVLKNINGVEKEVNQVSIRLTDKLIKKIIIAILDDLKEDERANKILTSIDNDFSKTKIDDDIEIIDSNASYTINIYTSKYLMKPLKLEVIYLNGNDKKVLAYEGNEYSGNIYYIQGDEVIYDIDTKFENNGYKFDIRTTTNKKVGGLKLEFNKERIDFNFSLDNDDKKIDGVYVSKINGSSKNQFKREEKLNFKFIENRISKYNFEVMIDSDFSKNVEINEDVSKAILETTLTNEEKDILKNRKALVNDRLER